MTERLRTAIEDSGLKKNFIADKIGVSPSTFTAMLNGTRKVEAGEFLKICRLIGRDPNDFAEEDEP